MDNKFINIDNLKYYNDKIDQIKQDILVSGQNIKTINGESILGEGDLTVEGGAKVHILNWDDESESVTLSQEEYDNIVEADLVIVNLDGLMSVVVNKTGKELSESVGYYSLIGYFDLQGNRLLLNIIINTSTKLATFIFEQQEIPTKTSQLENDSNFVSSDGLKTINGESIVGSGNIDISGGSSSGAYSEVNHGTSDTTFTLTPNTFHVWDEVASLTLDFGSEISGVVNEYLFQFTSGSTATSLTLPDDIKWANESAPTIAENMIYQVSVLKGLASVLEFSNVPESVFPVTLDYGNQDQVLNLKVFNEIHSVAQGSNITLNSGDLTFVLNGNNISVVDLFYVDYSIVEYDGYVLYDTGMEYYILNASGSIVYFFYD